MDFDFTINGLPAIDLLSLVLLVTVMGLGVGHACVLFAYDTNSPRLRAPSGYRKVIRGWGLLGVVFGLAIAVISALWSTEETLAHTIRIVTLPALGITAGQVIALFRIAPSGGWRTSLDVAIPVAGMGIGLAAVLILAVF